MIEATGETDRSRGSRAWLSVLNWLSGILALVLLGLLAYHFSEGAAFSVEFMGVALDGHVIGTVLLALSALLTLGVYAAVVRLSRSLHESRHALAQATSAHSERERAEVGQRSAEAQFQSLVENAPDSISIIDRDHRVVFANHQRAALVPVGIGSLAENLVVPEHSEQVRDRIEQVFVTGEPISYDVQREDPERGRVWYSARIGPILEDGRIERLIVVTTDISGRLDLEEQLRQAQKLEAVGQLTGGVAHDFNNLLTVILGNLQLIESELPDRDPAFAFVDKARAAARRGSALTQRLLAFASKQSLLPRVVDLGELVAGMGDLLRRTLGEMIAIHTVLTDDLWKCKVDPTQLENVILNLAINARDAMPTGGRIEIETRNVEVDAEFAARHSGLRVGSYVMLSITDAGTGMGPEVLEHVFEPFFTTKGLGRGSGLGLSMVYGFVKQSDGQIEIESSPDEGTCVRIHLPRTPDRDVAVESGVARDETSEELVLQGAGELILVVEDDENVRSLTVHLLERIGYKTIEAVDGARALTMLERASDVALVFTDIVLPGDMSGVQLGRALARLRPGLPVVYTSGYMANASGSRGLDPSDELVVKPFTHFDLAAKIGKALSRQRSG